MKFLRLLQSNIFAATALLGLLGALPPALAEDTDTPGDGHWEVKVQASGDRDANGWEIAAPEVEINYGLGDRMQITAIIPWIIVNEEGQHSKSGLGAGTAAFKWRFIDQDKAGYSMSVFPQYSWNLSPSSEQRGVVSPGKQLFVPVQVGFTIGDTELYPELGRAFIKDERDEWVAAIEIKHPCTAAVECFAQIDHSFPTDESQTSVSAGVKWQFAESWKLKTSIGRDFGSHTDSQRDLRFAVGLEFER